MMPLIGVDGLGGHPYLKLDPYISLIVPNIYWGDFKINAALACAYDESIFGFSMTLVLGPYYFLN